MSTEYWDCVKFIETKNGKKFARTLGSAKPNDAGGFSVYLDALPPDGKFSIVPQRPRSEGGAQTKSPQQSRGDDEIPF